MKYRKKPVIIEAMEYLGRDNKVAFLRWIESLENPRDIVFNKDDTLTIKTLEGNHLASCGDFIIQGVKGELYPCKPDIFRLTYEEERY